MNHCVPDFKIQMDDDEEYPIPIPSAQKKPSMQNDMIMELLWQNGQVVMQSQNQRRIRKPVRNDGDAVIPAAMEIRSSVEAENYNRNQQHQFMQEDVMNSWLHFTIGEDPPLDRHNFSTDVLCAPPQSHNNSTMLSGAAELRESPPFSAEPRDSPPISATRPPIAPSRKIQNFAHFSKHGSNAMAPPGTSTSSMAAAARELTVVDSCETPVAMERVSRILAEKAETGGLGSMSTAVKAASSGGRETTTLELTVTSSPGDSTASAEPGSREPIVDRKRKGREQEESEFQSEDVDFESPEAKKQVRGSTSAKRSRAAEVHNLSERKRRDRINEKMRALQELIPRSNKSDKASMLDEAIEYLKSLQLQVQMMSMGCGMMPMMFPGIQQYMPQPSMGMGIGMGMGMGMELGINRPVMPFPNMLASSALPAATAAAHLGPRFPVPPFHMPHVPATPDSSRMQSNNMPSSLGTPDQDQSRIPNFTDPYQQYLQLQSMQNQAMNQPNVSKPSTSRGQDIPGKTSMR